LSDKTYPIAFEMHAVLLCKFRGVIYARLWPFLRLG
jgi:hypothetical protein